MLKRTLVLSLTVLSFAASAQNKWGVSLGLSNQGQVDQVLHGFYFPAHETAYQDDATNGKMLNIKYNLGVTYQVKTNSIMRLRLGLGQRSNESIQEMPNSQWEVNDDQGFAEIALSYGVTEQLGRVQVSGGVELPFYIIGQFSQSIYNEEYSGGVMTQYSNYTSSMDGGFITGLNGFVRGDYGFWKRFSVFTEFNFGVLRSKLGNRNTGQGTIYPTGGSPIVGTVTESEKTQTKFFFSGVQAQFGVSVHF